MKEKAFPIPHEAPRFSRFNRIAIEIIVALLLIVWLHTSISKLMDFSGLKIQMSQSPVFYKIPTLAAVAGPGLEILVSLLLIYKRTRLWGLIGSCLLMAFFTWYVAYLMLTMPNLPCACGGVVNWMSWPQHLVFNLIMMVLAFIGILLVRKQAKTNT